MFGKLASVGILCLGMGLATQAASADSFGMWLTGSGQKANSFDFSNHGVDLHVTGGAYDKGGTWRDVKDDPKAYLGKWSKGIGIQNSEKDGSHTVDGRGWKDVLWLNFSKTVWVEKLVFGWTWGTQQVEILDKGANTLGIYTLQQTKHDGIQVLDLTGEHLGGKVFGLKTPHRCHSWKVKGVKGHAVPTPTAGLGGVALLGLLAARRRRRRA